MAEDKWKQYEVDDSSPPIFKSGVEGFAAPNLAKDDPWAKYEVSEEKPNKRISSRTPAFNAPNWLRSVLGNPEDSPSPNTVLRQIGKGIPILGHYIPENQETKQMEKNYPVATALARGSGAIGSTMGPAGMVSKGLANAGAPGIIPEMMGQFGLGGTLSGLDKVAEKGLNVNSDEILKSILWGGTVSSLGPLMGKGVSPASNPNRRTIEELASMPESQLEKLLTPALAKKAVYDILEHPITTGLGGAVMSSATGAMHPLMGAAIGAVAPSMIKGYAANTFAHNPTTQSILNSLMGHIARETQ